MPIMYAKIRKKKNQRAHIEKSLLEKNEYSNRTGVWYHLTTYGALILLERATIKYAAQTMVFGKYPEQNATENRSAKIIANINRASNQTVNM